MFDINGPADKTTENAELISSLFPVDCGLQETKARKQHVDRLGRVIQPGELYYCRRAGYQYENFLRLSLESVNDFADALFHDNPGLLQLARRIAEERRADFADLHKYLD